MRDRKDNRLCCHDKSGVLSGLARVRVVVIPHIDFSRVVAVGICNHGVYYCTKQPEDEGANTGNRH